MRQLYSWIKKQILPQTNPTNFSPMFVGREQELQKLNFLWQNAMQKHGQICHLSGSKGIGKTSLLKEFLKCQKSQKTYIECSKKSNKISLYPLIEFFHKFPEKKVLERWSLDHYSPISYCQQQSIYYDFLQVLKAMVLDTPLILVFDHLQWCDPHTNSFFSYIYPKIKNIPLLIILSHPQKEFYPFENIHLSPLDKNDTLKFLQYHLGHNNFSSQDLLQIAEGNPLYLKKMSLFYKQETPETVEEDQINAHTYYELALNERYKGFFDTAIVLCAASISLLQDEKQSFSLKAKLLCLWARCVGNPHVAEEKLQQALTFSHGIEMVELLYFLSQIQCRLKRVSQAISSLQSALTLSKTERSLQILILKELAECHFRQKQKQQALEFLEKAKEQVDLSSFCIPSALLLLRLAKHWERENWNKALEFYQDCLNNCQKWYIQKNCLWNMGRIFQWQGLYQQSLACYQKIQLVLKQMHLWREYYNINLDIIKVYIIQGVWSKAQNIAKKSYNFYEEIQDLKNEATVLNLWSQIALELGELKTAEQKNEQALHINQNISSSSFSNMGTALSLENKALIFIQKGDLALAEEYLEKAMHIYHKSKKSYRCAKIFKYLGDCSRKRGENQQALELYQKSAFYKGGRENICIEAQICLVKTYLALGEAHQAKDHLEQLQKTKKRLGIAGLEVNIQYLWGEIHSYHKKWEKALESFQKSCKASEKEKLLATKARATQKIGQIYLKQNKIDLALENFNQSYKFYPKNALGKMYISIAQAKLFYRYQKDFCQAQNLLERVLDISQKKTYIWTELYAKHQLGLLCFLEDHFEKALEYLQEALYIAKKTMELNKISQISIDLGKIYLVQNKPLLAMEHFSHSEQLKQKLRDNRGLAKAYVHIAKTYELLNRDDKALQNYQKSLRYWKKFKDKKQIANISFQIGRLHRLEARWQLAQQYLVEASHHSSNDDVQAKIKEQLEEIEDYLTT